MSSYKKLNTKLYKKTSSVITEDYIYWKKLRAPVLVKEFGPIDYIDFSPIEPYYFAITCSVRVQVYNPITKLVVKNLSRFRENAYGAAFRSDGKLLCAGGEEKNIKLFDVATKSLLRLFKGHEAPVHRTFFIDDKPQIVSFSDDKSVKIWDIPTETPVITYSEHSDYVRAGAISSIVPNIVLSGGYDNTVKMYDTRTEQMVLSVNHGSPVESLLFMPSGGLFLSAGGTDIKIWDSLAGGRLLGSMSQHHKTITCLKFASDNTRLLSGSLDRHVKIYDLSTFQVVHTLDYPNGILSLGVSKNDDTVVAGLVDGLISITRREDIEKKKNSGSKQVVSFQYNTNLHKSAAKLDTVVSKYNADKEAKYDRCLRKFEYSKALDMVLVKFVAVKKPDITVTVMQELIRRRGLSRAFQGRDSKSLLHILQFFVRNITDYRFTRVLIDAVNIFIDCYEDSIMMMPFEVVNEFNVLRQLLDTELELINELAALQGTMHLLMAGASAGSRRNVEETTVNKHHNWVPSENAQHNLVKFTVD